MTQLNTTNLPKGIDLTQDDLIECILKREGGSIIDFGFSGRKKITYRFQPLDPNDPESPHVCNVPNDDHYDRFMDIPEAYREFDPSVDYEPVISLASPLPVGDYDSKNQFDDLASVNPEEVTNDWLLQYAKEILGVGKSKQAIADLATSQYGLEFDYNTSTATDIIRMILVKRIELEKNAENLG